MSKPTWTPRACGRGRLCSCCGWRTAAPGGRFCAQCLAVAAACGGEVVVPPPKRSRQEQDRETMAIFYENGWLPDQHGRFVAGPDAPRPPER